MSNNSSRNERGPVVIGVNNRLHTKDSFHRETPEVKRERMGIGVRAARRVSPNRFIEGEWVTGITVHNGYDESGWYKYRRHDGKTEEQYVGHGML